MTVTVAQGKAKNNLIDVLIGVTNTTGIPFDGFLRLRTPEGFRIISNELVSISLHPEEKRFISLKILRQQSAQVGTSNIEVDLLDTEKKVLQTRHTAQTVKENNHMRLFTESPMVYMTNPNDSLALKVTVSNLGNKIQDVTLVFSIPNLRGEKNFFEQKGVVNLQKDREFTLRFLPPKALLEVPQFTVQVAAMRGSGKELFGNLNITVQNISSVKQHQDLAATRNAHNAQRNSLTTTYRRVGENINIYQIIGSADMDLSAGYLAMNSNIYMTENTDTPLITNTNLTYYLENASLKVGNISQELEMSLYGRGIEASTANRANNKTLQIGFIDQNYNLIERNVFLKRGYGLYASSVFADAKSNDYSGASYIFKEEAMDHSRNHMVGIERAHTFGDVWRVNLKGHGAFSEYEEKNISQASYALETRYSGSIQKVRLSGNYFLSSAYFPGNRRGVMQLHQNIATTLSNNRSVYSNISVSNYSPKSHTYNMNMESSNIRFNMGINFPRKKLLGVMLGFQHQRESRTSTTNYNGSLEASPTVMTANRITNNFNWSSKNHKHSVFLGMEEGIVKYASTNTIQPQLKTNLTYRYSWLNANATYQYGSFYLSENAIASQNTSANKDYQRMLFSIAANKSFMENKLSLNSGLNYSNDFPLGSSASSFLNIQYQPNRQYRLFLNSSWSGYQSNYNSFSSHNDQFSLEAGLSINFKGKAPSTARKGKITAQAYYDRNANNVFDEGDEIAPDYLITLNDAMFKTDHKGQLVYRSVPYGTYTLKSAASQGWFTKEATILLDASHQRISIPLHQNGTVIGKVAYEYDATLARKFEPKTAGILFNISKDGKLIQRTMTNNDGEFTVFLPNGTYQITLDKSSLASKTYCEQTTQSFTIESAKTTRLEPFKILAEQKTIKIKRFGS
ncbi:carboxypeptidase regulatory-like domain-containing protein [Arenibacter sp. 6A1]|uniref:carboxypeptidase-like regulatory domain-containing protein n=1 Tax=Arenibacter sp. 6A1 TaxID=2720391 RepID=UPI0014464D34|nr:carboxypeptidase-like regulatory domain-containing protein [Arenibacter sp. 6A1]NKI28224.1 carboxypeptidase regulatory-like domain-containing protein [Arenibacter sp. 6A1]